MAKVAMLLPHAQMCALAAPLVPEYSNISLKLDIISIRSQMEIFIAG